MASAKHLDDLVECSICTEVFTDPRVLPCIHTFCLQCLQNYGKDQQPGDSMPCPLCRKDFTVPKDGFAGIQKNFFMHQLLDVRKLSGGQATEKTSCDACFKSTISRAAVKTASMYCVQCKQNYCPQCSKSHQKMTSSADHILIEIGKDIDLSEILAQLPKATCDQHGKELELFCRRCELAICMMCFVNSHKTHNCSDIEEVSAELRKKMQADLEKTEGSLKTMEDILPRLDIEKNAFVSRIAGIEDEVNTTADRLIEAIERDREKLLSELKSIREKRVKEVETVKQEVEQHKAALESFKRYCEAMMSTGTASDLTRSASSLSDRAKELTKFDASAHVDSALLPTDVSFMASTITDSLKNLVGTISSHAMVSQSVETKVVPGIKQICGVTSLGRDVFVVRHDTSDIQVYDAYSLTLRRSISLHKSFLHKIKSSPISCSTCLAACAISNCVYVSDPYNSSVHRVGLSGSNAVTKWSVASGPTGLSVNSARNVLVVSEGECKLQEYTTRGALVRNIQLQSDIEDPRRAVQLSSGQFVVSHGIGLFSEHRVCLVGEDGKVIKSYGGSAGSGAGQMDSPRGLSVDRDGRVLVADQSNNRLLVLDQSLSRAQELKVNVYGGLNRPCSLWFDKARKCLYIGEKKGARLIVIDNLSDFRVQREEIATEVDEEAPVRRAWSMPKHRV